MAKTTDFNWTDEAIAKLKEWWADDWTCSQIGIGFGVSRNAVIGKVHRLGLPGRADASKSKSAIPLPRRGKTRQRPFMLDTARFLRDMADPAFDMPAELPPSLPPVTAVFFHELQPHHCRFPYGEGSDMLFCGAIATHGPYCAAHHAVTHLPARPRKDSYLHVGRRAA